jgi:hypothetical protein
MTIKATQYRAQQIQSIQVMGMKVDRFPEDVQSAFSSLENKLHAKKNRKFLGALNVSNNTPDYTACIEQSIYDDPMSLGLQTYKLPGGKYITGKLINWTLNTHLIQEMFGEMGNKYIFDPSRPQLEYYKSKRELILMLPVLPREEQLKMELF